jgi:methionine-rich copper-binding protein CopC
MKRLIPLFAAGKTHASMTHRIFRWLLTGFLIIGATGSAMAHAYLDHAAPPAGSTLGASPATVKMWFTEAIEPAYSGVEITDATGTRFDNGQPHINQKLMRISLKPLPPGEYTVHWHVISVDTHATEGNFTFEVMGK